MLIAGCGRADTSSDPGTTARTFVRALAHRDGATACRLMIDAARAQLVTQADPWAAPESTDCARAVSRLKRPQVAEYAAMAAGTFLVDQPVGRDNRTFTIAYDFDGPRNSNGSLQPQLDGGFRISGVPRLTASQ
jgi:hypothetical protein